MNYRNLNYEDPNDIRKAILMLSCCTASEGGTVTTPGGSDGQIQYNNGGAFGGASGFEFLDSDGRVLLSNQPSPTPAYALLNLGNGPFDGATSGYFAGNGSGTVLAINTASGYTGDYAYFQKAGVRALQFNSSYNLILNDAGQFTVNNSFMSQSQLRVSNDTFYIQGSAGVYSRFRMTIGMTTVQNARLHVRGDGTNDTFRAETSTVSNPVIINSSGVLSIANTGDGVKVNIIQAYSGTEVSINSIGSGRAVNIGSSGRIHPSGTVYSVKTNPSIAPTSGTAVFNIYDISPTINQTGGANGNITALYINPTLASLGGTFYAFHSTNGHIRMENLPTSSAGLPTGALWNDSGTLKIV